MGSSLLQRSRQAAHVGDPLKIEALSLELAIAHTRWATHGKPTKENAHPHFDEHNRIAVVHNGIIENHNELRDDARKGVYVQIGHGYRSDRSADSQYYEGDFFAAVQKDARLLQGFWGHRHHP